MTTYTVDDLRHRGAEPLMRALLYRIHRFGTITYKDAASMLSAELNICKVFPIHVGQVAEELVNRIQAVAPDAPLINVVVVNQDGLPGEGADLNISKRFPEYPLQSLRGRLVKKEAVARATDEVRMFQDWPKLYKRLFKRAYRGIPPMTLQSNEIDASEDWTLGRGGPESRDHKRLKSYVLRNFRKLFEVEQPSAATKERPLLSGDRVDVLVQSRHHYIAVEVKSRRSNDTDFLRGIYQCVKYRAVLDAQFHALSKFTNVAGALVTERPLPDDLASLAGVLRVRCIVCRPGV